MSRVTIRPARPVDIEPVLAFTGDTWGDRLADYVPRTFPEWVRADDEHRRTLVATLAGDDAAAAELASGDGIDAATFVEGDGTGAAAAGEPEAVVGCVQGVLLSEWEAWAQGIRVNPAARGLGVGTRLTEATLDWARSAGATVCRNMVFSWNAAGLGQSRAAGFDPITEFRFARPEPRDVAEPHDASGVVDGTRDAAETVDRHRVVDDPNPDASWAFWQGSDARDHLRGLVLNPAEPWSCSELTRRRLGSAAAEGRLMAVRNDGISGMAVHVHVEDHASAGDADSADDDDDTADSDDHADTDGRTAVYGVAAWRDVGAAGALYDAIERDAADRDAGSVRVLIPETVAHVSDTAANRVPVAAEPDFVLSADLTDPAVGGDGS